MSNKQNSNPVDTSHHAVYVEQLLQKLPPLSKQALLLAAIVHQYDVELLRSLRMHNDSKDKTLVELLVKKLSFVEEVVNSDAPLPCYKIHELERDILQKHWIEQDSSAYRKAHQRALAYWRTHPDADPFIELQNRLYHLLIVDLTAGMDLLVQSFRDYANLRHLAALDRLLHTALDTRPYLAALVPRELAQFDDSLLYLEARLAQLRGQWRESLGPMWSLRQKNSVNERLYPYVVRGCGLALAKTGSRVEALAELEVALEIFSLQAGTEAQQAYTMVGLGDTYVDLAVASCGYGEQLNYLHINWLERVRNFFSLPLLPLLLYLSWQGIHLWHPRSWATLEQQDWIIARLFGLAAQYYRRADKMLKGIEERSEWWGHPAEKLAWLYLRIGEPQRARHFFKEVLEDEKAPPTPHTKASVQTGMARACLTLGHPKEALELLDEAIVVLEKSQNTELQPQAYRLLAEANFEIGERTKAIEFFDSALQRYLTRQDLVGATEVVERLWQLEDSLSLNSDNEQNYLITRMVAKVPALKYLVRFQHPSLVSFRGVITVLLTLFIFLVPMLTIQIDPGSLMQLNVTQSVIPPLETAPAFSQSPFTLTATPEFQTIASPLLQLHDQVGLRMVVFLFLSLMALGLYAFFGMSLIAQTALGKVQEATESEAIRLDHEGITVGTDHSAQTMRWDDVTDLIITDIKWLQHPILNYSAMILGSNGTVPQQITIQGNTNSYESLKKRLPELLPASARIRDLSYSLLLSRVGVLYVLGITSLTLFVLLNKIVPTWMNTTHFGTPYSMIDFYPYFYLGLFLPPLWWWVVKPLYTFGIARLGQPRAYLWGVVGIAFSLAILRAMTGQWLLFPDIYPELTILTLLASAIMGLWLPPILAKPKKQHTPSPSQEGSSSRHSPLERGFRGVLPSPLSVSLSKLLLTLVMLLMIFASTTRLVQEITAYDHLLVGHKRLQEQNNYPDGKKKSALLSEAMSAYNKTLALHPENQLALQGRAATLTLRGEFEATESDYNQIIADAWNPTAIYADRAITYQSWSLALREDNAALSEEKFDSAVRDFSQAITPQPSNVLDYYLWRGISYQAAGKWQEALNDYQEILRREQTHRQALFNQGWVYFERANALIASGEGESSEVQASYEQALVSFQQTPPGSGPLIPLAIGYAHFGLQDEQAAQKSWLQAISLNARSPDERISRGTAYWSLGTLEGEACPDAVNQSSDPQKESQNMLYIQKAVDDFTRVIQLEPNNSLAYRTLGQLHYLLRYCAIYDYEKQMRAAIANYQQAVKIEQSNAISWQYLARLQTAFYLTIYEQPQRAQDALALLTEAARNIDRSYNLNPNNSQSALWRNDYIPSTAQREGEVYYSLKNYDIALTYFELSATYQGDNPESAFKAGLSSLALGNEEEALKWYNEGIQRAMDYNKAQSIQSALNHLTILTQNNPQLDPLAEPIRQRLTNNDPALSR